MNRELEYISTRLDCYRFHSVSALQLKCQLQHLSVLHRAQQSPYAEERELLSQFRSMFQNNPFLEHYGIRLGRPFEHCAGEITCAQAEGFHTANGQYLTLYRDDVGHGACGAKTPSDATIQCFVNEKTGEAERVLKIALDEEEHKLGRQKLAFSHVLQNTANVNGAVMSSPGIVSAMICVAFYLIACWYLFGKGELAHLIALFRTLGIGAAGELKLHEALTISTMGIALLRFPQHLNTVVKGLYRTAIRLLFALTEQQLRNLTRLYTKQLDPKAWMKQFGAALRRDRELAGERNIPAAWLSTTGLLKPRKLPARQLSLLPCRPWSQYNQLGEGRHIFFPLLLSILMLLLHLI